MVVGAAYLFPIGVCSRSFAVNMPSFVVNMCRFLPPAKSCGGGGGGGAAAAAVAAAGAGRGVVVTRDVQPGELLLCCHPLAVVTGAGWEGRG